MPEVCLFRSSSTEDNEDHNLVRGFFEGSVFHPPLLEAAGFVDILDNGEWRVGAAPFSASSIDIPGQSWSGSFAGFPFKRPFYEAYIPEALFKEYIPDDHERREYSEEPRFYVTFHF